VSWVKAQPKDRPFFLYFAPVAVHQPITPSARTKGQSRAGAYGDFIHELDFSVGRVLQTLDELGLAKDTVVIFSSDNGGDIPTQPEKPEAKARVAGLLANGKLRGDKHTVWEGGVRVPYVVRWPDVVPAGKTSDAMISVMDTFATVAHLVDGSVPDPAKAAPDSFTFRDALLKPEGNTGSARQSMVVANDDGIVAIRRGPWKLIEGKYPDTFPAAKRKQNDVEAHKALYHLGRDPGEQVDVLASEPAVAAKLEAELVALRKAAASRAR
jgi:arylsulfatase A